ncbi:MAG: stage II sporulation protein M [Litorimonas sp.]
MPSNLQLTLKSQRFREERKEDWRALEALLGKVEAGRVRQLSNEDMLRLPRLYRATLSALSVARATSLDQSVITYLESLTTRAYYAIYGSQIGLGRRIVSFFRHDWPRAMQLLWKDTAVSTAILVLGTLLGYFLEISNPDWFYAFVPSGLAGERSPAASTESLRAVLYDKQGQGGLGVFAAFLFSHNSRVAILCFALGFAFCIPTVILLLMTGLMLGGFIGLYASRDLGLEIGGWLSIHGTTEIFAIILAGAAGLYIGRAIAFPGERLRINAASHAGQTGGLAMAGVIIMLLFAGLLEGYGRQLINADWLRYVIGLIMLTIWLSYFYIPRDFSKLDINPQKNKAGSI